MGTDTPISTQEKQVSVPVPEDRVPEFYAFYARFLAGGPGGRRGRRPGPRGHGHPGHGCHSGRPDTVDETVAGETPPAQAPGSPAA